MIFWFYLVLAVYVIAVVAGCYFMIYHNGGVKSGNWEEEE